MHGMPWLIGSRLAREFQQEAAQGSGCGAAVTPPHHHQFLVCVCGSHVTSMCAHHKAGRQHPITTT